MNRSDRAILIACFVVWLTITGMLISIPVFDWWGE